MDITVKNIDKVKKALQEIKKLGDKDIMSGIGTDAIKLIKERTISGKDVDHNTFESYSNYYKKKSGKSDPPDLKVTGTMLNAMSQRVVDPLTVVVRVVGEKAYNVGIFHQAGKQGMPQRKWFGIEHEADVKTLLDRLKKLLLAKVMKSWNK